MEMKIRLLNEPDAESYWELRLEALQTNPEAFSSSYEEAITRKNPIERVEKNLSEDGNDTFGAFMDKQLIGVVTLIQEKPAKLKHRANLVGMYVSPDMRGSGVGKALVLEALRKVKGTREVEKVNLSVVSSNEAAKQLYHQVGFKVFGREEKALKVNDVYYDEEHMTLFLN